MSSSSIQKHSTTYKSLVQIVQRLHNPQVAEAYRETLDSEPDALRPVLKKNLTIYSYDSILEIVLKLLVYYLIDSRLWISALTPQWWANKKEGFRPQLCIKFRPVGIRKRFAWNNYARNPELHIPHYNGDDTPTIPSYTIGQQSAKYILKDQSYILVNAETQEEAIRVVAQLASYVKESKRPEGTIEENITTTKRRGKLKEVGIKIEPFKGEYFTGGKDGIKSGVRLQF